MKILQHYAAGCSFSVCGIFIGGIGYEKDLFVSVAYRERIAQ